MSTFDVFKGAIGSHLADNIQRMFDVTPNPKGATQTREALEERSPPPAAEGREP